MALASAVPERRLLMAACKARPTELALEEIRRLASGPLDWHACLAAARAERVSQLAAATLRRAGVDMPADIAAWFDDERLRRTTLGLAAVRQLRAVQVSFASAGIPMVAYKGPALAVAAYGDVGARAPLDIDILVPRGAVEPARERLSGLGYRLDVSAHRLFAAFPALAREDHFHPRDPNDFIVELHVAVVPWALATRFDIDAMCARATAVSVGGATVMSMAAEDHLLVVAAHAAGHWWRELRHASEIDGLATTALDWDAVLARARQARVERILAVALIAARDLFGTALSASVSRWADRDHEARRLAADVVRRLSKPPAPELRRWPNAWMTSRYRERPTDRLRFIAREQFVSLVEKLPWERLRPPPRHLSSPPVH
jgi:hypothetical protein